MTEEINVEYELEFNGENLKELEPVLQEWIKVVEEYSEASFDGNRDVCWWHTERANVGTLAAAAWRTERWIALEEYSTKKHGKGKVNESRSGRCDLYIGKKNRNKIATSFAFEAKVAWQEIGKGNIGEIEKKLNGRGNRKDKDKSAWHDAGDIQKNEAGKRVAACFVRPCTKVTDVPVKQLKDWLGEVTKMPKVDALAWVFPEQSRSHEFKKWYYPGVVLVLRERHRSNSK